MNDLISRQAAIEAVEFGITYAKAINKSTGEVKELFKEGNKALNEAVERLKELPPAQPERKKGKWLPDNNSLYEMRFVCSECHESEVVPTIGFTKYKPIWDFCPNCGADMRKDGVANADVES